MVLSWVYINGLRAAGVGFSIMGLSLICYGLSVVCVG